MNEKDYEVEIVRKAVKHLTLRLTGKGVVRLTVPLKMPQQQALQFLESKRGWLAAKLQLRRTAEKLLAYGENQRLRMLDNEYMLHVREGRAGYLIENGTIVIFAPDLELAALAYDKMLRVMAVRLFPAVYERFWQNNSGWFAPRKPELSIRDAGSRWGSWSAATNRVMLSSRLVVYPQRALELIIAHELCHTVVRGHGSCFYQLLDKVLPDWRERKKCLARGASDKDEF